MSATLTNTYTKTTNQHSHSPPHKMSAATQSFALAPGAIIHKPTKFATAWLIIASIIVAWDFSYIFLRPLSFASRGGKLSFLWPGYDKYEFIDLNYSAKYWDVQRGFPMAQSSMNVIEDALNFTYLYLAYNADPAKRAISPVFGFAGVLMTFSKTVLYFLCDYFCGWCESGHNDWGTWIFLYLFTNGFWIVIPGYLTYYFARELAVLLTAGADVKHSSLYKSPEVFAAEEKRFEKEFKGE